MWTMWKEIEQIVSIHKNKETDKIWGLITRLNFSFMIEVKLYFKITYLDYSCCQRSLDVYQSDPKKKICCDFPAENKEMPPVVEETNCKLG